MSNGRAVYLRILCFLFNYGIATFETELIDIVMPQNKNAIRRYIILDRLLSDKNNYYTRTRLMEKVSDELGEDVSKRTIELDLEQMPGLFNFADIEIDDSLIVDGKKIVRYADQTRSIFSKPISDDEKRLLHEVLNTLGQFEGLNNFEWLDDLKKKLAAKNASWDGREEDNRKVILFSQNKDYKNLGTNYLATLFTAIANKKLVTMLYRPFKADNALEITLFPYFLKQYNNRWYLLGSLATEPDPCSIESIRNYPIDRMESVEMIKNSSFTDVPSEEDLEDMYSDIYGITFYVKKKPMEHLLAIGSDLEKYVETKPFHPYLIRKSKIEQEELHVKYPQFEDYSFWSLSIIPNYEFISLLKSYGSQIIVVDVEKVFDSDGRPQEDTREVLRKEAKACLGYYDEILGLLD